MLELLKGENELLQNQLDDMKAVESDSQAIIKNQETTISSLKNEKEVGSNTIDTLTNTASHCSLQAWICKRAVNGEFVGHLLLGCTP